MALAIHASRESVYLVNDESMPFDRLRS